MKLEKYMGITTTNSLQPTLQESTFSFYVAYMW